MQRFFVDQLLAERVGETVVLPGELGHQLTRVLRLKVGATILLLDGSGLAFPVELVSLAAGDLRGRVGAGQAVLAEPRVAVTLYAAPLKGDHFVYTLQKATEVGVSRIVPLLTTRTVVAEAGAAKRERWQRIVREAAEQSGRGRVPPVLAPQPFAAACRAAGQDGPALIPWEAERTVDLPEALGAWAAQQGPIAAAHLFVGPEGGFTAEEVAQARAEGLVPVSLGPRILRAETAAVVAAALTLELAERSTLTPRAPHVSRLTSHD